MCITAGLALWYLIHPNPKFTSSSEKYFLPDTINIVNTNLPYHEKIIPNNASSADATSIDKKVETSVDKPIFVQRSQTLQSKSTHSDFKDNRKTLIIQAGNNRDSKILKNEDFKAQKYLLTDEINFSKDFHIITDRYTLTKGEDWLVTRAIGHVASLSRKLFFWDWDISKGPDYNISRSTLAMLEKNKSLDGLTVRLGYNEALYDFHRLFHDPQVKKRNNWFFRATFGFCSTFGKEIWAELGRGDYYNPWTQTAVVYSNVESIAAHELGHHQDFHRFKTDAWYSMARALLPVTLYQEWKASTNARDDMLANYDKGQFNRYLLPAFFTYLLFSYNSLKRLVKKIKE